VSLEKKLLFHGKKNKHHPQPLKLQQPDFGQQELKQFGPNKGPTKLFLAKYPIYFPEQMKNLLRNKESRRTRVLLLCIF
jgi:hypothetical protein